VKVGLYFDLRNPPGWQQDWQRLYTLTLEVCEEADRLGIGSLWFSEHHLFNDGYLSQPLTFAAAVAARTRRARLGTAVMVAPIRRAAQIAEEATVVDLISGGRLDLGLGTGYRKPEFDLFEESLIGRYDRTDARVRKLRALWASGELKPPPVQDSVPIWLGYQGPKGARRAGVLGEGLLSVNGALLEPYRDGLGRVSRFSGADAGVNDGTG
jgi:alkanesulfonate monooxygenase SsuD/methylene tetrahydromethanopterin reductase-like flavin-dependent oxidoreductase (luciferase family)